MKKALRTLWTYILAFTVDLKKTAQAANEAESTKDFEKRIGIQK